MNRDDGSRPYVRALVLVVAAAIVLSGCITTQHSPDPGVNPASDGADRNDTPGGGEEGGQDEGASASEAEQTENQTAERNTTVNRSEYTGGTPELLYDCDAFEESNNAGGACFSLPNGTLNITIEIEDDTSPSVGAYWYLINTSDGEQHSDFFCDNTTASLSASNGTPITADAILVSIEGPYKGNFTCALEDGGAHAATGGTITATIRSLPGTG